MRAQFFGDGVGQAVESPLGGGVGGAVGQSIFSGEGGDVDDVSGVVRES